VARLALELGAVGRATFEPGWRWSEHVKPIAKTESCQAAHTSPGAFAIMPSGHDAWVVGDEPCVVIDWQGFADHAKPRP
jgi:hypothetical protein